MSAGQEPREERLSLLLARRGRVMNLRMRQALGVTGLGPKHGTTLLLVQHKAMSQQQIIESLAIDASAVVAVLNDLEGDGLVVRTRDPADRRRHIVAITKLGEKTARQIEHAVVEAERETFVSLTAAEAEQLHALLSRLSIQSACTVDNPCAE